MPSHPWYRYLRFWRRNVRAEIDEELRFHFESRIEELVARGLTPETAHVQAVAEFGDVDVVRSGLRKIDERAARRRDRSNWVDGLRQDVVYAARSLRRTPVVSLTIVLTLALGLGVNAAMFSLLDVVFFRPPAAVAAPDELRRVWSERHYSTGTTFSEIFDYSTYAALDTALGAQTDMALYRAPNPIALAEGEDPPTAIVSNATASYFRVLGIHPQLGRFFGADEDRLIAPERVAVISDLFWHRQFEGDRNVLGKTLPLGGVRYTIIGVAPPRFTGVDLDAVDVWRPVGSGMPLSAADPWYRSANVNAFRILFRLHPGAREGELEQRTTARLRAAGVGFRLDSTGVARFGSIITSRGPGTLDGSVRVAIRLAGVALIVFVIACANVVNLLLARAIRRRREIAVRLALGVSRARLLRLLVTESVLLALVAVLAAIVAAAWGGALLRALLLPTVHWAESPMHWRVFAFALAASLVAGALAGLIPAVQSWAPDLTNALKAGAREGAMHRSRLRSSLVVVQAALSVVLLVGAALFLRSLRNVEAHDIGYAVNRVAMMELANGKADAAARRAQSNRLLALESRFASIPGVERVAYTSTRPAYDIQFTDYFPDVDLGDRKKPPGIVLGVTRDYFAASGTRLLRGNTFPAARRGDPYTVIVNDVMAKALWPGQNPIGHCIRFEKSNAPCATVIGVTQSSMVSTLDEPPTAHLYVQLDHTPIDDWGVGAVLVRVDPARMPSALATMRTLLRAEFPSVYSKSITMAKIMEPQYRPWKLGATLFSLFGCLALVVAGIGVYSSISYAVGQRTHEFGVRTALGATARDVMTQVLGEGVRTVAIGIAVGLVLAVVAGRLVASLLYDTSPTDPMAMLAAVIMLLSIGVVASFAPAWRATKADPVSSLRAE